ncbi:MAG TPA: hypothetical protein VNW28_04200 [Chthoniobacterales bacterium]|nr:hypothetical protein [Chthoniobacterales bacterium]
MRVFSTQIVRLTLLVLCVSAGRAPAQEIRRAVPVNPPVAATAPPVSTPAPATPTPPRLVPIPPPNVPAVPASVNDTAHFLAGLPVSEGSPLVALTQDPAWQRHAAFFNQAWTRLDAGQLAGLRTWEASFLPDATQPLPVVFYMFSGPDLLYAEQFFPNARTYVLAGTEPIGPLPDILRYAGPSLGPALQNLDKSLNSVLNFSFFITKEMKTDLQREDLKGTLPIFYVFLARSGKSITDITFITLDKSGQAHISGPGEKAKGLTPGIRITFRGAPDAAPQTLYYFTTDLSDDGIRSQPGFIKFCEGHGAGYSLLKSASYLMFEGGFDAVQKFLLSHSKVIVQDDSGIPITDFDAAKWQLRFFGAYAGPIDVFKQHFQPQLQAIYQRIHPGPLGFGIGYRWNSRQSTLIVAARKGAAVSPPQAEPPSESPPPDSTAQ